MDHEIAIVGAGPIGLELAAALKRLDADYVHFEAGQIGQTITWYPHQARFFSSPERIAIAGVPLATPDQTKATREQYLAYLRAVTQQFDLRVHTYERLVHLEHLEPGFRLTTERRGQQRTTTARYLVLATGDMHRPRRLGVPGEDLDHVSHYFQDPHPYFGQRLLIVGGKNSAAEAALRCHHAGARVALSYRGAEFSESSVKYWLLPELKSLIKHGKIDFYPQTVPTEITPDHVHLGPAPGGREAEAGPDGATQRVPADFVLLLTGYVMDPALFEMCGVEMEGENQAPRLDPHTQETNVPGLFVAGTAAAGTQVKFRLFIENCHPHVARIVKMITGQAPPPNTINEVAKAFGLPES